VDIEPSLMPRGNDSRMAQRAASRRLDSHRMNVSGNPLSWDPGHGPRLSIFQKAIGIRDSLPDPVGPAGFATVPDRPDG
jgi:hypothetical protein